MCPEMTMGRESDMRVRKVIHAMLSAALLVAAVCSACSKESYSDGAIRFRTNPDGVETRAGIESNGDLQESCSTGGEAVGIIGKVSNEYSSDVEIFSNQRLYYSGGWKYDNPRYWVRGAVHEFLAIYPHSESLYTYDSAAGTVTYPDITLGNANNIDLMWAVAERDLVTSSDTTSPVELQLHHAFALLEFRFVNASSAAVSSVSGIALEGVQYKGSFGFSEDGTSSLSVESDLVAADSNIYVGSLSATNIPVDLSTSYNLFENMGTLVVMPQEVYHKSAELKMQVAGGVRMGVNLGNTNSVYTWEAGKKYIYTMTLTTSTITFDVSVREWIRDEVEL